MILDFHIIGWIVELKQNWCGGNSGVYGSVNVDAGGTSGSKVLELRGAFVTRITGTCLFEIWSETYNSSCNWLKCYTANARLEFEDSTRVQGSGTRGWGSGTLPKDFVII
jgi:hypothetical protein